MSYYGFRVTPCPLAQGYVDVLLCDVVAQRRLRGEWPLSEVPQVENFSPTLCSTHLSRAILVKEPWIYHCIQEDISLLSERPRLPPPPSQHPTFTIPSEEHYFAQERGSTTAFRKKYHY